MNARKINIIKGSECVHRNRLIHSHITSPNEPIKMSFFLIEYNNLNLSYNLLVMEKTEESNDLKSLKDCSTCNMCHER